MNWTSAARRLTVVVLLGWGLTACAGAIHQLPIVSDADVNRATSEIQNADGLDATKRSPAENAAIVRRVAARLQQAAGPVCRHVESPTCTFQVVFDPSDELDAYAYGSNRITITQGLAKYLETDSEFATVIAHEMGHHMNDHITKLMENQAAGAIVSGILFGALAVATGAYDYNPSGFSDSMDNIMQAGSGIGALSYSKEHEREADYIAAYLMMRAGYDLNDGRSLWAKLTRASGDYETGLFDTHPSGPDRLAAWDLTISEVERSPDMLPNLIGEAGAVREDTLAAEDSPTLPALSSSTSSEANKQMTGSANQSSLTSTTVTP